METLSTLDIILSLLAALGILGLLGVIVLQHRKTGDLIEALTDGLKAANDNTRALDLVEVMATKVVPVSAVKALNQGADLLETFTPDQGDALIEQVRKLFNQITDGKPNTSGADATNTQTFTPKFADDISDAKG